MRITKIAIQGFRSFTLRQEANLDSNLCLVYGQNSHGKTSMGEALEFLFCGKTARRDVVASTKTEYVDSLKNAFHSGDVFVEAWISYEQDGSTQAAHIRRKLTVDYPAGNAECESILQREKEDGTWETFTFASIGLPNWNSPDCLPIIFQHTLRYVSAAKPSDRLQYFRELLDIKDITKFREDLKQVSDDYLIDPEDEEQKNLVSSADQLRTQSGFSKLNSLFADPTPARTVRRQTLIEIMRDLLSPPAGISEELESATENDVLTKFSAAIADSRSEQSSLPTLVLVSLGQNWIVPTSWDAAFSSLITVLGTAHTAYAAANEIIDEQTSALMPFLQGGVALTDYSEEFSGTKECHFCGTADAVTWERIQKLKSLLAKPTAIQSARNALHTQLNAIHLKLSNVKTVLDLQLPEELASVNTSAVEQFSRKRADLFETWKLAFATFKTKHEALTSAINTLVTTLNDLKTKALSGDSIELPDFGSSLTAIKSKIVDFEPARTDYVNATTDLMPVINAEIDEQSGRQNWSVLKSLWDNRTIFHKGLIERCSRSRTKQKITKALADVTTANGKVLKEDKFPSLSRDIASWWNMLRPQEPVAFKDVSPKGQGLTSIDLKALLVNEADPSTNVERNAVAVFSDSQLNCLGLCIFLARTAREETGFIIFDDPVQSLDREHAEFLTMDVVKALMDQHGMQVIILTHDDSLWGDLKAFYGTLGPRGIKAKKIKQQGTLLIDQESQLGEMFRIIDPIHRIPDETVYDLSANKIRIAAELFCRDVICKFTVTTARPTLPSHYTGENLGQLIIDATPHLVLSPSHTTTLQYISRRLNKGSHADYEVYQPGNAALRRIFGELRKMARDYELPL